MPVVRKSRRRRVYKAKRVSRKKNALKLTRQLNMERYCDATTIAGFTRTGALTASAGYLTHTTAATVGSVTYGGASWYFQGNDLPGVTELGDLYESFRINKIKFRLIPLATGSAAGAAVTGSTTQTGIIFHWCLDYDDASIPTATAAGVNQLRQRQGYKTRNVYSSNGKPITITWVPKVNIDSQPRKAGWFDEGNLTTPHYGLKMITESVSAGSAMDHFFKLETKLYVSWKGMQ